MGTFLKNRNPTFKMDLGNYVKQHNFEGGQMVYTAEIAREYWNLGLRTVILIQIWSGIIEIIWNQIELVHILILISHILKNHWYWWASSCSSLSIPDHYPPSSWKSTSLLKQMALNYTTCCLCFLSSSASFPFLHSSTCLTISLPFFLSSLLVILLFTNRTQ